jgi:periplasmic protein TonB
MDGSSTAAGTCRISGDTETKCKELALSWRNMGDRIASLIGVGSSFLGLPSPRLPARRTPIAGTTFAAAAILHLAAATLVMLMVPPANRRIADDPPIVPSAMPIVLPPHLLFRAETVQGGGGGGGGNRQNGPIRHAEGVGHDTMTLRTIPRPPQSSESVTPNDRLPSLVLDAKPMFSGTMDQLGLPVGGVSYGTSTGPGSGGGVGTGSGTGLGSGEGPGVGPGSGGGFGGGPYRPGGAVVAPRILRQTTPRYTSDAMERRIQGSVWLEIVVTRDGVVGSVHVTRSLDPGGLDEEAVKTVREWQFEPGRLSGKPVDVVAIVVMDFSIR